MQTESSAELASPPEPRPRRLGIAHLMLWTAGSAVTLAFLRGTFDEQRSESIQTLQKALALVQAPFYGAALACLPLVFWRPRPAEQRFPTQPGHWLLLVQGVSLLTAMLVFVSLPHRANGVVVAANAEEMQELLRQLAHREVLRLAPTLAVTLLAAWQMTRPRWRSMFLLMALGYGLGIIAFGAAAVGETQTLAMVGTELLWLLQTISAVALLVCVLRDWAEGMTHDFLHTTGITARFAIVALGWIAPWLYYFLAFS
jgi:hypothetical protein